MRNAEKRKAWILALLGILPIAWISLLVAPAIGGGLPLMIPKLKVAFQAPFRFVWCERSLPTLCILLCIYGFVLLIYHYTKPNHRRREEHGSAKWGKLRKIMQTYTQYPEESNKILTQNVSIGYDAKAHRRNLNTLVVGGSGAGKTRFFAKPNVMQANTSFVILDPKGGATRS